MSNYVDLRHSYLTSKDHLNLPQSRTVLVTGVPKKYLSTSALEDLTASLPGGIRRVWISRELKQLPKIYNDRLRYASMLESAELELCKAAIKHHKHQLPSHLSWQSPSIPMRPLQPEATEVCQQEQNDIRDPVNRLVSKKMRPTHRPGFWGMFGKKVDTIEWCKVQIVRLTKEIDDDRKRIDTHPPHNSAL